MRPLCTFWLLPFFNPWATGNPQLISNTADCSCNFTGNEYQLVVYYLSTYPRGVPTHLVACEISKNAFHQNDPLLMVKGYLPVTDKDGQLGGRNFHVHHFPSGVEVNPWPQLLYTQLCVVYRLISICVMDHEVSFVLPPFWERTT